MSLTVLFLILFDGEGKRERGKKNHYCFVCTRPLMKTMTWNERNKNKLDDHFMRGPSTVRHYPLSKELLEVVVVM